MTKPSGSWEILWILTFLNPFTAWDVKCQRQQGNPDQIMKLARQKESSMSKKRERRFSIAEIFRTFFSTDKLAQEAAKEHQENAKKQKNKNS